MLSVSQATGPVEGSYAKLTKIYYKNTNTLHSKILRFFICWQHCKQIIKSFFPMLREILENDKNC